jgi:acetylornithine deacetylase
MDAGLFLSMLSTDSTSSRERDYALILAKRFSGPGRKVETFEVGDGTLNLRISWGDPKVFFCTHLDTVPPYIPPAMREIKAGEILPDGSVAAADDILFTGRGTCDAKGQCYAMYQACLELEAAGRTDFALLLLAGEETGSFGAKAYNRDCGGGDAVVVGEPTGGAMVSASKGTKSFEIVLGGRPCHSGYPSEGESAVERFVSFVQALRGYDFPVDPGFLFGEPVCHPGIRENSHQPQPDHDDQAIGQHHLQEITAYKTRLSGHVIAPCPLCGSASSRIIP